MANNYIQPTMGYNNGGDRSNQQQMPIQYPYNNNLIMNSPYDNYTMGRMNQQNSFNQNQQFLKCRPVASREEAVASQIDLDGSLWVFTDINNGKIYTKQINNDGTATFNTYVFTKQEDNSYSSSDFVTKDEFNKVIQNLMAAIKQPQSAISNNDNNGNLISF